MELGTRAAQPSIVAIDQQADSSRESYRQKREAHDRRVVATYQNSARQNFNPTDKTQYLNIGYWKEGALSLDEAAQAMARLVGESGQFSSEDRILDAGCGYGDAAIFWMKNFRPQRIIGIDINQAEVERAGQRAVEFNLDDRLEFRVASAVETPFEDASFDKVVSIEASHHFLTREDFFRESYRVLKNGGKLVTTDVVPLPGRKSPFLNPVNSYSADIYAKKLADAGFTNVKVTSIRDFVFKPYSNFLLRRLGRLDVVGLFNVLLHRFFSSRLNYILATADKLEAR